MLFLLVSPVLPNGNCPRVARREEPHVALSGVIAGSIDSGEIALRLCCAHGLVAIVRHPSTSPQEHVELLQAARPRATARSLATGTVDGVNPLGSARDGLRPLEATPPSRFHWVAQKRRQDEARHRQTPDRTLLGPSRRVLMMRSRRSAIARGSMRLRTSASASTISVGR